MKHIIQGTSDYLHDCWHDFLCCMVKKTGCCVFEFLELPTRTCWHESFRWKEGSVLHYIRQRKIAKKKK